jgi:hypothetical protein
LAAVLTEIYLYNVCSCHELLRRNGAAGQGEVEEATTVYRADIKLWKDNMWGLLGLKLCLEATPGAEAELATVSALHTERSARADQPISRTCFCAQPAGAAAPPPAVAAGGCCGSKK